MLILSAKICGSKYIIWTWPSSRAFFVLEPSSHKSLSFTSWEVFIDRQLIPLRYPYISHLICNAGVASFSGIEWPAALKQLAKEPINAVTAPLYYRQHQGEISADGLGWVWQCNVFGHYCLVGSFAVTTFFTSDTVCLNSSVLSNHYSLRPSHH